MLLEYHGKLYRENSIAQIYDMKLDELHKQPKAVMKQVWQTDEHQGKGKKRWHNKYHKKATQYRWPKTTYHGQSEGYDEHIL